MGCVELGLDRLRRKGPLDVWEPIARPLIPSTLGLLGLLWKTASSPLPQAALKLTLTIEGDDVGGIDTKDQGATYNVQVGGRKGVALADVVHTSACSGGDGDGIGGGGVGGGSGDSADASDYGVKAQSVVWTRIM